MKKILFVFLMLFSLTIRAQDKEFTEPLIVYIGPSINTTFDGYVGTSVSMLFYNNIAPNLSTRTTLGMNFISIPLRDTPGITFALGLEYQFPWFYMFLDIFPHLNVHGIGHQVYGDYTTFYFEFDLGIGYNLELAKQHSIYFELAIGQEVTIFNALREDYRNGTFPLLSIGYSYRFF
jgi:hypothetical protein